MNKTEIELQYDICDKSDNAIPVIIVAAGTSSRMKGINKQFMPILGVPVITVIIDLTKKGIIHYKSIRKPKKAQENL